MTRYEWRQRAQVFARSATALLANAHYDTAYHLAGIAVECALKSKIAGRFRANDTPDKKLVVSFYKNGHDLAELVKLAQLEPQLTREAQASIVFRAYWETVKDWKIDSRYKAWSQAEATQMVDAVVKRRTGVLSWIKRHW